jgi:hypothetical protein
MPHDSASDIRQLADVSACNLQQYFSCKLYHPAPADPLSSDWPGQLTLPTPRVIEDNASGCAVLAVTAILLA